MSGAHGEREHSLCSASNAHRWLACPGSVGMGLSVPPQPSSPEADEGTRAHELAERLLNKWLRAGRKWTDTFSDEERPAYQDTRDDTGWSMVDYVLTFVNFVIAKAESFDQVALRAEMRLTFCEDKKMHCIGDVVGTGTRRGSPIGFVVDLKYGMSPVKAEANPQLGFNACALKRTSRKPIDEIETAIAQPRLEEWFSEATLSLQDLEHWSGVLHRGAERALMQAATKKYELVPGEHCRYCPALGVCGAHQRYLSERAAVEFADEPVRPPAVERLSPEQIGRILSVEKELGRFIEAVRVRADDLIRIGTPVPGWKRVEGRTKRRWAGDADTIAAKLQARGVSDPWDKSLRSFTDIEKQLGKGKIDDLLVKPAGSPTLAPDSDSRPPLPDVAADFNDS